MSSYYLPALACVSFLQLSISLVASAPAQIPLFPSSHSQDYEFDALLHLPGISPYFDAIGSGLNHKAPPYCEVTAASYLIRHAAIYANDRDYEEYIEPFLKKLNTTLLDTSTHQREGWTGPLSFFNKWKNPISDPENQLEQITPGGIKASKKVGKHLLDRYPLLAPTTKKIYSDKKQRTHDTAAAFVQSFSQEVEVIEVDLNGTNFHAQDPHKACKAFSKKPGDKELHTFMKHYTPPIIGRLQSFSPVTLDMGDVMGLQQLCGYESAITGKKSAICDVFSDDEWMAYEYAWDLKYSYMVGHGNPLSPYLGFPWLNATSKLMFKLHQIDMGEATSSNARGNDQDNDDNHDQRLFLSFTHREVPPFIATALGLFNSSNSEAEEFPTDRINWSRSWRMAELIPFLGHVGVEKLTCTIPAYGDGNIQKNDLIDTNSQASEYIRIIANSSPRPIPVCQGGPGASCPFDQFTELIEQGMKVYGDFDGICGNNK